jgi:DNA-binding transcriptional LysR family regulator
VRLLTSLAVVNLQQEGIDLAIRMGQGDWEGMESRHLFADEQLVVAAPAIAAATCRPPRRRSPPAILFFPWSPGTPGAARRGWKSRSSPRACA